ncbi:MAG: FliH/SctL family protein [Bacillota bacterium]
MKSSSRLLKNGYFLSDEVVNLEVLGEIATTNETHTSDKIEEAEAVNLEKIKNEAVQIYAESQKRAAHLVEAAENDADMIKEKAYRDGYQEGLNKAKKEYEIKLKAQLEEFAKALDDLGSTKKILVNEVQTDLLELLSLSTKKICQDVVDDQLILRVLDETLPLVEECTEFIIEVNSADLDVVKSHQDLILSRCLNLKDLKIVATDRIEKGGFFVTSSSGNIDATLSTRIDSVIALFNKEKHKVDEAVLNE